MKLLPGVYIAKKKNGTLYYRSSITFSNKHISLGSFSDENAAHEAYKEAYNLLKDYSYEIDNYNKGIHFLSFDKWVVLINFRDNKIYIKNPIYIMNRYFIYYININTFFKFDVDDLFYYSTHKIMKRGGHLFVSDYGMQINILSRYGIKNYGVVGRDYKFANGDSTDLRYGNIEIINKYHGVSKIITRGLPFYLAKIHVNGDIIIGRYPTEVEAAIAYNKAVNLLKEQGIKKNFYENYIVEVDEIEYARIYHQIRLSKKIRNYIDIK
ncbi:hypothetical protein EDD66_101104 [Mobilisporobacter senegalensis]|uniref:AP2/ERF domain-containing protein n=1 Tax=Mobilisporobacter senegalensis TaxID=1329262 RepID=A0A3N1XYX9_9FIRM|nr:hypothetical protein [Mobilisporobacter senegalensis]ROR31488.1 hypothetical protein EDD66_101104 [Mobilisporobacter senegalensis]